MPLFFALLLCILGFSQTRGSDLESAAAAATEGLFDEISGVSESLAAKTVGPEYADENLKRRSLRLITKVREDFVARDRPSSIKIPSSRISNPNRKKTPPQQPPLTIASSLVPIPTPAPSA
ncbi:hypothetical protein TrLO_g7238 [Triparma laevis f. longispina]|uniref:Uncharacterized protein n=1 Tax=Triparma laevis f. longispina TaxID=1714387 RepID=A0A9W7APS5_9STRA|nr:hypothetical protein TrLO_g7238 [Triparma laevis f. longispina]